ncbi:MAG: agmatine deiminase family protein [Lentisphaerota bacterium]
MKLPQDKTPTSLGFAMPPEWEKHAATWMAWPHYEPDWPGKLAAVEWVYGEMIRKIAAGEKVCLLVNSPLQEKRAAGILRLARAPMDQIKFHRIATDRAWMRDSGPIFIKKRRNNTALGAAVFCFNAWAKYPNWEHDTLAGTAVAQKVHALIVRPMAGKKPFVLEGGSIDVNGRGSLLTTEECLLDPATQARNPGVSKDEVELILKNHLGAGNILWLGRGIAGDDTHGHVDDVCRFVNARTVVCCQEKNSKDENYRALAENEERLQGMRLEDGSLIQSVPLPMPSPLYHGDLRLPASYANFYVTNTSVLVPTFNDAMDRLALGILSELFANRTVTGIHAVDLVRGFGTIHCLTQQQPEL